MKSQIEFDLIVDAITSQDFADQIESTPDSGSPIHFAAEDKTGTIYLKHQEPNKDQLFLFIGNIITRCLRTNQSIDLNHRPRNPI